jgi:gamma-glutamylputrescine oxidase
VGASSSIRLPAETVSTRSPWQIPFPPDTCDVAVIGGGIVGSATAHALAELAPQARVVLIEADTLAAGASGRNAGFLIPGTHSAPASSAEQHGAGVTRRLFRFTLENIEEVTRLDGAAFDLQLTGSLLAAGSQEEAEALRQSAELLQSDGVACEYLDADATCRSTGGARFAGGLVLDDGGSLDPAKLVRHLARLSGATLLEHWPATGIEKVGGGVRVWGPHGSLVARRVVICLNAFLPRLIEDLGRFVRPVRAQMLATAPVDPFLDVPVYSHEGFYYVRQRSDGRILLGGARHLYENDEVGYETVTSPGVQDALETYLNEHFPKIAGTAIERRWSGIMGFSPDGIPVAGPRDGQPNVFFACGLTGHGMSYGVRLGRLMARLALDLPDEAADLFSPGRFASPTPAAQGATD